MDLYKRKYRLLIGDFELNDQQIKFNITKTNNANVANKLNISLINLKKEHRNYLAKYDTLGLELYTGFGDSETVGTFFGTTKTVYTEKKAENIVTNIQAVEGGVVLNESWTTASFPQGITALSIINRLLNDIVSNGKNISIGANYAVDVLSSKIYKNGYSINGNTKDEIMTIINSLNLTFSIQNGFTIIADKTKPSNQASAYMLDKSSGLLDSPQKIIVNSNNSENEKVLKKGIQFTTSLLGNLYPDSMVCINSNNINGIFKIFKVNHVGDYQGTEWISKCEAMECK